MCLQFSTNQGTDPKMLKKIVVTIFILTITASSVALAEEKNPIDKWFGQCVEKDSSTAGMLDCCSQSYEMWDKELNKTYRELR